MFWGQNSSTAIPALALRASRLGLAIHLDDLPTWFWFWCRCRLRLGFRDRGPLVLRAAGFGLAINGDDGATWFWLWFGNGDRGGECLGLGNGGALVLCAAGFGLAIHGHDGTAGGAGLAEEFEM